MKVYFYTNVGKVRTNNEDGLLIKCTEGNSLVYYTSLSFPIKKEESCYSFVVSDGMGGTEKGEVATKIVLENLNKYTFNNEKELESIFNFSIKQLEDNKIDGGCAVAGIEIRNNIAKIFNVGDCRVYKKNRDYVVRLSKDHSLVEEMVDNGLITLEEAHIHPKSNLLTSSIMPHQDFKIFFKEETIKKDDIFLICSDGVWGELSIDELDECFKDSEIDKINESLFNKLSQKEQKDNLTYILIKI